MISTVVASIFRRLTPKTLAFTAVGLTILLCGYYANYTNDNTTNSPRTANPESANLNDGNDKEEMSSRHQHHRRFPHHKSNTKLKGNFQICPRLNYAETDVDTVEVFKDFDFQPTWMKTKEYWDKSFEDRYERQKMDPERPPLKVIIIPHSHNDPGWLKTFENYYHYTSRQIMSHMVTKLQQYKNLTFIWSEIAFLNAWWEDAHPSKQRALRNLVQSGRLEITTGGWVMTDEANVHIYAMVDQMIEGHQWVAKNLGVKPTSGWSVDPFGHGSTVPYILASSGFKGTVIQRIHYAWKQWLALKQYGDFKWTPSWGDPSGTLLTHNQPFDIYSIKHSCGPHPYVCLNFDFRKVSGEYTEYSIKAQAITDKNVKEKAELLLEQYSRTGSLLPHNVVLMPLGDDFRYNVVEEWDQQYSNYIKLIDYINANKETYKAEVVFGTPSDYFVEITKRYDQFPSLKGDFFVYSDIFSEGRPAYWSGYFTTRPFMKILDRELEHNLRSAEIVYTIALNNARTLRLSSHLKVLESDFEKLVKARRNLALFQHHDAITGTSKANVMKDYGLKMFESIRDSVNIQQNSLQSLIFPKFTIKPDEKFVLSDLERDSYEKLPRKTTITIEVLRKIVLYNSLAQPQEQLVQIRTNTSKVKVVDDGGNDVLYQINPVWDADDSNAKFWVAGDEFEVVFIAKMRELSIRIYKLVSLPEDSIQMATIYCNKCHKKTHIQADDVLKSNFVIKEIPSGDIQLKNDKLKLLFNGNTGFLKSVVRESRPKLQMRLGLQFAAYRSAQYHSGAYLFMPDPNERDYEKDVLLQYKDQMTIIITYGPISSEISVIYGAFLVHTVAIYHNSKLSEAVAMENVVDFENSPKNRETELFMRLISDVQNGEPPEFYSDLNGFQMQKRTKVDKIGIEGNYFPITTMAYIQDENLRLSLLTNHAQGAASWQPGYLEVMLDRRTLYDDSRGMGEGLVDNRKTINKYWMLIEDVYKIDDKQSSNNKRFADDNFEKGDVLRTFNVNAGENNVKMPNYYSRPSLYANSLSNSLNYPVGIFVINQERHNSVNKSLNLLKSDFPCDLHLLNLRTQPDKDYPQLPSSSALMVLHRQGYDCSANTNYTCERVKFVDGAGFRFLQIHELQGQTLTGLDTLGDGLNGFNDIFVETMALKTFNVTFL